jgi:hypothetical protein
MDSYVSEISAFGGWFASGKFDDQWAMTQLKDSLNLVGFTEPYHLVLERLAKLGPSVPKLAVECLALMVEGDKKRNYTYGWHEQMRAILEGAIRSKDPAAKQASKSLIDRLLARDRAYGDFRDLLRDN